MLIRTILSFSLEVEVEGVWPWQPRDPQEAGESESSEANPSRGWG